MYTRPAIITKDSNLSKLPILVETMEHRSVDDCHMHNYIQIWYSLRGELHHRINGVDYIQPPGKCGIVLPFVPHKINSRNSEAEPRFLSLSFEDRFLLDHGYMIFSWAHQNAKFEGLKIPTFCELSGERKEEADKLAEKMISEFSRHHDMDFEVLASLTADFLRILCTEAANEDEKEALCIYDRATGISNAVKYMSEHISEKITLDDLCTAAMMSRCSFTKNFKAATGKTSSEFLMSLRLQLVQERIIFTDMTLTEIAKEAGFYDSARLVNAFTAHNGMSPKKFRETHKERAFALDSITKKRWEWLRENE